MNQKIKKRLLMCILCSFSCLAYTSGIYAQNSNQKHSVGHLVNENELVNSSDLDVIFSSTELVNTRLILENHLGYALSNLEFSNYLCTSPRNLNVWKEILSKSINNPSKWDLSYVRNMVSAMEAKISEY